MGLDEFPEAFVVLEDSDVFMDIEKIDEVPDEFIGPDEHNITAAFHQLLVAGREYLDEKAVHIIDFGKVDGDKHLAIVHNLIDLFFDKNNILVLAD